MYTGILLLFQPLTVTQIKKVQSLIQESNDRCAAEMKECETVRHQHLVQIGNTLHLVSCPDYHFARGGEK